MKLPPKTLNILTQIGWGMSALGFLIGAWLERGPTLAIIYAVAAVPFIVTAVRQRNEREREVEQILDDDGRRR
jgi:hypothetical protein